jgi:hypothetical protein
MYFYNNWLAPQLDLLTSFPHVASVTGYPVRTSFRWGNENTKQWGLENAMVENGRFLPDKWEDDFAVSIGRSPADHANGSRNDVDTRLTYEGKQAYATSHHCQHIGYAGIMAKALEFDGQTMGEERNFDIRLDRLGLRLATIERLTRHMGNIIDDELRKEIIIGE